MNRPGRRKPLGTVITTDTVTTIGAITTTRDGGIIIGARITIGPTGIRGGRGGAGITTIGTGEKRQIAGQAVMRRPHSRGRCDSHDRVDELGARVRHRKPARRKSVAVEKETGERERVGEIGGGDRRIV